MLEIRNIKIKIDKNINYTKEYLLDYGKRIIEKKIRKKIEQISLKQKSLDARKKEIYYVLSYLFSVKDEDKIKNKDIYKYLEKDEYLKLKNLKRINENKKVVIVGMGPAGLFSALVLSNAGFDVTIIERGKKVEDRIKDINNLEDKGILNTESNVQFGEGGAGTFSDGKLATFISSPYIKYILETFVSFGSNDDILYEANPHIGSDNLRKILINFRLSLLDNNVSINYETKLLDFDDHYIYTKNDKIAYDELILATGHSASDIYQLLEKKQIKMKPKNFAVGFRIEHNQKELSKLLYHDNYPNLPAANYKIVTHLDDNRTMYSFCMCPGGEVINSTSDENRLVTNGMSNNKRDNVNANSALLINVNVENYYHNNIFDGLKLQKEIEEKAFNKDLPYYYPVQTVGSFLQRNNNEITDIIPSIKPGYYLTDLKNIYPKYISDSLRDGLLNLEQKWPGFIKDSLILTAPETRTSSTITIERNADLSSTKPNLYVAGEGGGHAGGITSSAVDGIKIALKIIEKYR